MTTYDPYGHSHRSGEFDSPTYYLPATDRERAIGRLQEMAGDPSLPPQCPEQEEARRYLRQVIREDPLLRNRLKYWKQYIDAPNGKERLYKEVVLPKLFEQLRFRHQAAQYQDAMTQFGGNSFTDWHPITVEFTRSPWFRGWTYEYYTQYDRWRYWSDHYVPQALALYFLFWWTKGFYLRYFPSKNALTMIKNAKNSRRFYGRFVPQIPNPAHSIRNKFVLQAISRKMIRDGKAHNIHLHQALNSLPR